MFAAAWYFPKLNAFSTACSPCFLHYFPRVFEQAKLPLLSFFNFLAALQLVQRGQLSKKQRDNGDCLFTLLLSEIKRHRHGMQGKRENGCVHVGLLHTGEGCLFQICFMSVCCLLISLQTNARHHQQPCWATHAQRLSWNPAMAEEISLGCIRWADKRRSPHLAVCFCLKKLH